MAEERVAVSAFHMIGELDAMASAAQEACQLPAAVRPGLVAQVATVDFQQVESIKKHFALGRAAERGAEIAQSWSRRLDRRQRLPVQSHRSCRKPCEGVDDPWHSVGPIVAASRKHANPIAFATADEAEAV